MRRVTQVLFVALAMTGCHDNDAAAPSHADNRAAAAINEAAAANTAAAVRDGLPVPRSSAQAIEHDIAEPFLGEWGMTKADCDPSRPDRKGLVVIKPDKLVYYESRGSVTSINRDSPNQITLQLSMDGEGQQWQATDVLKLNPVGTQLQRTEQGQTYTYDRC
jgi:hypothetical protein